MNFKPRILKIVLSILIGLFIGVIYQSLFHGFDYSMIGMNPWVKWMDLLIYSIIPVIAVYIIWSLFEKKK